MPVNRRSIRRLEDMIRTLGSAGVAFSGGADSSVVARLAKDELGERSAAFTVDSPLMPRRDIMSARKIARAIGIRHVLLPIDFLSDAAFAKNPVDRCYLCKRAVMAEIIETARADGLSAVLDGKNADDDRAYRPGSRACKELGVRSPLAEAGISKADVVALARKLGLPMADKDPSPCLATRIPYGEAVTADKLKMVEKGEAYLASKGFTQVRVRHHGTMARIEVAPGEIHRLAREEMRALLSRRFKSLGFSYVTVDLQGYRSGSMDEVFLDEP